VQKAPISGPATSHALDHSTNRQMAIFESLVEFVAFAQILVDMQNTWCVSITTAIV